MSVLVDKSTRVVCQGITGSAGSFHSRQMLAYKTNLVAGVTPGKGGSKFDDKVPVFDTVAAARLLSANRLKHSPEESNVTLGTCQCGLSSPNL